MGNRESHLKRGKPHRRFKKHSSKLESAGRESAEFLQRWPTVRRAECLYPVIHGVIIRHR